MCRFVYYQGEPIRLSRILTEPEHSLIHQSFHSHEREEPLNGDGFGVAWYVDGDPDPAVFRSVSPAWGNPNLRDLARVTSSSRLLAHVRAATQGHGVAEANCHPFRMRGLAFMHNGDLGGFPSYRRSLVEGLSDDAFRAIEGNTDSEHFLALVTDALGAKARSDDPPERLAGAVEEALGRVLDLWRREHVDERIYVNCVATDGRDAVACRYTNDVPENADTLYAHLGMRYACTEGRAEMVPCPDGRTSVIVSSEPLTTGEGWKSVPVGHVLLIGQDQEVRWRSLRLG